MRRNVKAAVIAALIVTGANAFTMVSAQLWKVIQTENPLALICGGKRDIIQMT